MQEQQAEWSHYRGFPAVTALFPPSPLPCRPLVCSVKGRLMMLCRYSSVGESGGGRDVSGHSSPGSVAASRLPGQPGSVVVDGHRRRSSTLRLPLVAKYLSKYSRRRRVDCSADVCLPCTQSGNA